LKIVGRYHIQARIGEGAMANVYRAFDPEINRTLAIKVLKREYCRNPQFSARFLREARAAGALSHPNIVTIYDVGEIEGFPYIAMELLDGAPLDGAAEKTGRFHVADVMEIGGQLASALAYAHAQGVIHRDIKPSNIVLSKDGRSVKILDFGIARVEQDVAAEQAQSVKTQFGQVLGTPRYMSPEQALGRDLDGRSDLFSVGVLLYELITGEPAFDGGSAATLALQITQRDPAPINVMPECPRGLRFIVEKLLAKRPDKRFANGAALFDALEREKAAYKASLTESRRSLSIQAKLALLTTLIATSVLIIGGNVALKKQYAAMERVALSSGSSIASFVASNSALAAAENSALAPELRDWVPTQAFVNAAAADPNITQMVVVDHEGVIQASTAPDLIGAAYIAANGRRVEHTRQNISVTNSATRDGARSFRFTTPIEYAGRQVGLVDVSINRTELDAAAHLTRAMMVGLVLLALVLVGAMTFLTAQFVLRPLRRLRQALNDAAGGNLDFRLSVNRRDEFGDVFEAFNGFAGVMQARLEASGAAAPINVNATTINQPANDAGAALKTAQRGS
jgi:serine/threonine protein kinase/HAMP domain-containing protein